MSLEFLHVDGESWPFVSCGFRAGFVFRWKCIELGDFLLKGAECAV